MRDTGYAIRDAEWPEAFRRGLEHYWRGRYWDSHEAWEEVWRAAEEPVRSFMKALIQIDAALIHAGRQEWTGVRHLLERVLRYLGRCPDIVWGIRVPELKDQVRRFLQEVTDVQDGRRPRFRWSVKPRIRPVGLTPPRRERLRRAPTDGPPRQRRSGLVGDSGMR